jgi:hypothetical protein
MCASGKANPLEVTKRNLFLFVMSIIVLRILGVLNPLPIIMIRQSTFFQITDLILWWEINDMKGFE